MLSVTSRITVLSLERIHLSSRQSSFKSAGGADKLDAGLLMPLVNIAFLILGIVLNSWDSTAMHKFRRVFRKG